MKCLVYVSRVIARQNGAVIPSGLSGIFRISRKRNSQFGITGVLSYRNGYYIQVLEGDEGAVNQLYSNIEADSRHRDVTKLFESPISNRVFPDWDMKLLESVGKNTHFLEVLEQNSGLIDRLGSRERALLQIFIEHKTNEPQFTDGYNNKALMLSEWPDLISIKPTPTTIELCARLTKRSVPYTHLMGGNEYGSKSELDELLGKFDARGVLVVIDSMNQTTNVNTSSGGGFYLKMRNFLGLDK